jgi:DNA repair exonuclease SbcCD ATPase subunit
MKKLLITLLTITLTASEAISQTSSDTICLPTSQLKKAINRIEECKVIAEDLALTKQSLNLANQRISVKDSIIQKFEVKGNAYEATLLNYQQINNNLESIIQNLKKEVSLQKKAFRRQKLSKWFAGGIGIAIGFLIAK